MSINQLQFSAPVKQFLFKALAFLLLGLSFSASYAQVCGTGSSLIANRWTMVALPCMPTSATVQDVFGDDLGNANYNIRWVVYERNEATDTYVKLDLTSTLNQGESYWILSLDAATFDVTGTATPLIMGNPNCPSAAGCFEVMLTPPDNNMATRQNMVGHPFPFDVDWADVVVEVNGTTAYTPSDADTAGLVSKTIHKYNGNGYDPFDDDTPAMLGVLNIYDGIWVETLGGSLGNTVKLLISDPNQPPVAQNDSYNFAADTNQNIPAAGLFNDNGSGADNLSMPPATLTNFGGGSLGGAVTDNAAGASVAFAGGSLMVNGNGSWSLTGQPFTPGTHTFDYRLDNGVGTSDATVTLMITALAACNNDTYTATGNVGINSTNGINQSVLFNDTGTTSVTAFDATSNNGGNVNVMANGEFTYNPPAGFNGADSFTYTADGSLVCTANITVSDRIWFIDNSGANGDGRLGSPFNSITNFNISATDMAGDSIFIASGAGNYFGPLTLLNNQKLIGQGSTDTIATISGITFAPLSNTLPVTSGARPVIAHTTNNLTLAQGNTVRGLDLSNSGGTALTGSNFGNLTLSEVSVNNTAGVAINLNSGNPTASFNSVSASNGANGIILSNTTGSFTVTGDGGGTRNGSGGTIQNITGDGISLNSATNVSISQLNITDAASQADGAAGDDHAIDITSVTNFTYQDAIINGFGNSVGSHDDQHSIKILNLFGTSLIDNVRFDDINEDGIEYINNTTDNGTQDVLTVTGCDFNNHLGTNGESAIQAEAAGTSNMALVVNGNTTFDVNTNGALGVLFNSTGSSTSSVTVDNSTFNAINAFGGGTIQTNNTSTSNGTVIITNNTITGAEFNGITILNNDSATSNVTISGNTVQGDGTTSQNGFGLRISQDENGTVNALIDNNDFGTNSGATGSFGFDHIRLEADDTTNGAGRLNATITNNESLNIPNDIGAGLNVVSSGNNTICVDIRSNTFLGSETFPGFGFDDDIILNRSSGGSSILVEQTSTANITALNTITTIFSGGGGGNPTFSAGNCPTPP